MVFAFIVSNHFTLRHSDWINLCRRGSRKIERKPQIAIAHLLNSSGCSTGSSSAKLVEQLLQQTGAAGNWTTDALDLPQDAKLWIVRRFSISGGAIQRLAESVAIEEWAAIVAIGADAVYRNSSASGVSKGRSVRSFVQFVPVCAGLLIWPTQTRSAGSGWVTILRDVERRLVDLPLLAEARKTGRKSAIPAGPRQSIHVR